MWRKRAVAILAICVALAVGGCGEDDNQAPVTQEGATQPVDGGASTPEELEKAERKAERADERLDESLEEAQDAVESGSGDLNY